MARWGFESGKASGEGDVKERKMRKGVEIVVRLHEEFGKVSPARRGVEGLKCISHNIGIAEN